MIHRLALGSLQARRLTVGMTVLAIGLSVALLLGVEKIRTGTRVSFADTISGTDLIVGARSGSVQLLLYSVFRIGNATNNVTWKSYQDIASRPEVDWIVPVSLGDSHRQFRVMGTSTAFFQHYKFRRGRSLTFAEGGVIDDLFDTVIGHDVAQTLGYVVGDPIVVAHGLASFATHKDQPFQVSGILKKTGTPVDRTVIISMRAIEAIHVDWQQGAKTPGQTTPVEIIRTMDLTPKAVTAAFVGVKSPLQTFALQRAINRYPQEPVQAVLPGVALQELWGIVGVAETALMVVSMMVVATALIGMMTTLFASLSERRREMAILRAVGASPVTILGLFLLEAIFSAIAGVILGVAFLYAGLLVAQPVIDNAFGIFVPIDPLQSRDVILLFGVVTAAGLVSLLPAYRAYRLSLADGMMVKT